MSDDYEYGVPDPDYGDLSPVKPPERKSVAQLKLEEAWRIERLRDQGISSNFNRHMIDLFNNKR